MRGKRIMRIAAIFIGVIFMAATYSFATPPIWETDYGDELEDLTEEDDEQIDVEIGFDFPFEGMTYTTVYVGTNGCLQLGDLGDDDDIDYDLWEYMEEFLNDLSPIICPFNSDLDLSTTGTIHFNDFDNRAVFTWNEIGTNENEEALNTFQVQLYDDGTIVFGYNGILDDPEEDLLEDLDEGIVVGISASDLPECVDPGTFDLNGGAFSAGTTIHQRWCYDEADSCECNDDDTWTGPVNTEFDLDQENVIFSPDGAGYRVYLPPVTESTNATIAGVTASAIPAGAPANFTPESMIGFVATGVAGTADISLIFASLPSNPVFYKVVGGTWIQIYPKNSSNCITDVSLSGNTLSYTIADNSDCDIDDTVGTIEDPVAAGSLSSGPPVSNESNTPCFITTTAKDLFEILY